MRALLASLALLASAALLPSTVAAAAPCAPPATFDETQACAHAGVDDAQRAAEAALVAACEAACGSTGEEPFRAACDFLCERPS